MIAANEEFIYVRDRQGRFLVFDAKRATDPAGRRSAPLAGIDLSEFNVLGIPSEKAFAVQRIPDGQLQCAMPEELRAAAGAPHLSVDAARQLDAGLRQLIAAARSAPR